MEAQLAGKLTFYVIGLKMVEVIVFLFYFLRIYFLMSKKHNYEFKKIKYQLVVYSFLFFLFLGLDLAYFIDTKNYLNIIKGLGKAGTS